MTPYIKGTPFKVDHEFKVLRFASDAALIVAITGQKGMDVFFPLGI